MTTIRADDQPVIPPRVLPPLSIGGLAVEAAAVLWDAERWGLPRQSCLSVSTFPDITIQFEPEPSSFAALAQWAESFGGAITTDDIRYQNSLARICRVIFTYHGVPVKAFVLVRTATATT